MIYLNKVFLTGILGQDAEIKVLQSGKTMTKLNLAVSEGYKDQSGNWVNKTNWFTIKCFKDLSDLKKGDRVHIDGALTINEWQDKAGNKQKSFEINCFNVTKLIAINEIAKKSGGDSVSEDQNFSFNDDSIPF